VLAGEQLKCGGLQSSGRSIRRPHPAYRTLFAEHIHGCTETYRSRRYLRRTTCGRSQTAKSHYANDAFHSIYGGTSIQGLCRHLCPTCEIDRTDRRYWRLCLGIAIRTYRHLCAWSRGQPQIHMIIIFL